MGCYSILGVHRSSTPEEIKKAYMALAKENHPDHNANDAGKAAVMAEVNVAYGVLSDPKNRKNYDRRQMTLKGACEACGGKGCKQKQKGFSAKKVSTVCSACHGEGTL